MEDSERSLKETPQEENSSAEMKSVASSPAANVHSPGDAYTKALAMVGITTGYIFGPIIIFGGIGYFISQAVDNKLPLFLAFIIAFAISNWLIFKHTPKVMERMQGKQKETK